MQAECISEGNYMFLEGLFPARDFNVFLLVFVDWQEYNLSKERESNILLAKKDHVLINSNDNKILIYARLKKHKSVKKIVDSKVISLRLQNKSVSRE